jgi:hypothetical protein
MSGRLNGSVSNIKSKKTDIKIKLLNIFKIQK